MRRTPGRIGASLAALLLVLVSAPLRAQPPAPPPDGPGRGRPPGPPPIERTLQRHAERLGLEDATLVEIDRIASESRPRADQLRADLHTRKEEMRDLLSAETPDEAAVMQQAERIGRAEVALQQQRLRTMLKIRALLSAEQRAELVRVHEERRAKRRDRRAFPDAPAGP